MKNRKIANVTGRLGGTSSRQSFIFGGTSSRESVIFGGTSSRESVTWNFAILNFRMQKEGS